MPMQSREELFLRIMIWFSVCTTITGLFNMAAAGAITLGSFAVDTVPGQITVGTSGTSGTSTGYGDGANSAIGTTLNGIDFTTLTTLKQNVTYTTGIGTWTLVNGQGLTLTSSPLSLTNGVFVTNVMSVGNNYTVSTKINNNQAGGDFSIYARHFSRGYPDFPGASGNIKLTFALDGIHLKKPDSPFGIDVGDDYFYPLSNARNTINGGSTITTVLTETPTTDPNNPLTSPLTVIVDGNTLFTTMAHSLYTTKFSNQVVRHAGVESGSQGFIVVGFPSTPIKDTSENTVSGPGAVGNESVVLNPFAVLADMLSLVGTILGISNTAQVPFWLWAIITGCPIATLMYMNLELLRGT